MIITDNNIVFSVLWISLMLVYLLGDVIRIFAGDFESGEIDGEPVKDSMWVLAAVAMVIPIIMVILNILLPVGILKWPNIVLSIFFILFNLVSIKGYKLYDQFLLILSFGINILVIVLAFLHL